MSHVSFSNRSSAKQSLPNIPKPINLNLTHFLKGNFSEDYADKNEADIVINNKTQVGFVRVASLSQLVVTLPIGTLGTQKSNITSATINNNNNYEKLYQS